jgi:hypothetical protein
VNEGEWLACDDPEAMLKFLGGKPTLRKLRLFACACCRRVWGSLTDPRSRQAIAVAERFADGLVDREEFVTAALEARKVGEAATHATWTDRFWEVGLLWTNRTAFATAGVMAKKAAQAAAAQGQNVEAAADQAWKQERGLQGELLRDLFGNPFRAVDFAPSWRTPTTEAIGQQIYEEGDFTALPVLADALEDAGCAKEDVLAHCRSSRLHVRGCWVVDTLLAKEIGQRGAERTA